MKKYTLFSIIFITFGLLIGTGLIADNTMVLRGLLAVDKKHTAELTDQLGALQQDQIIIDQQQLLFYSQLYHPQRRELINKYIACHVNKDLSVRGIMMMTAGLYHYNQQDVYNEFDTKLSKIYEYHFVEGNNNEQVCHEINESIIKPERNKALVASCAFGVVLASAVTVFSNGLHLLACYYDQNE